MEFLQESMIDIRKSDLRVIKKNVWVYGHHIQDACSDNLSEMSRGKQLKIKLHLNDEGEEKNNPQRKINPGYIVLYLSKKANCQRYRHWWKAMNGCHSSQIHKQFKEAL